MNANGIQTQTPATYMLQFVIGGSAAANTSVNASFLENYGSVAVDNLHVPPNQVWSLARMYVPAALTINMLVNIKVDGISQELNTDTSVMIVNSVNVPINPFERHMQIDSNQTFYFYGVTDTANSSTDSVTETVYLYLTKYPLAMAKALNSKGISL